MPMKMNMTFWTPPMPHWCVMWIVCSFTGPMLPKPRIRPWCRFCTWRCGCTQMHLGNGFRIKSFGSFGKGFGFYMSRAGLVMRLSSPKRCAAAAVSGACHFLCNLSTYLQQFPTKNPPLEIGFVTYCFLIEGILASSFNLFTLLTTTTSPWSWWDDFMITLFIHHKSDLSSAGRQILQTLLFWHDSDFIQSRVGFCRFLTSDGCWDCFNLPWCMLGFL